MLGCAMKPNFDSMTEADVREIIVRPFLSRLGYTHGSPTATVRTEVPLRYGHAFLGRKKPSKDPVLAGRADYICDAISYGRWVVEVKSPAQPLKQDDVEQAHTYAAHPEISASHFLMTNGREFRLYATSKLDVPLITWTYEEIDERILSVFNVIGYDIFKQRAKLEKPGDGKPLGKGLGSSVKIISGELQYGEHFSDHPLFQGSKLKGLILSITAGRIQRAEDGRLSADIEIRSPIQTLHELNKLAGFTSYNFYSADEYISTDIESPTIFQNVKEGEVAIGTLATLFPGAPPSPLPFGFQVSVFTEVIGYFDGDVFKGTVSIEYDYFILKGPPTGNPQLDAVISSSPAKAKLCGGGEFTINVARE
jgi:hypothetical protein